MKPLNTLPTAPGSYYYCIGKCVGRKNALERKGKLARALPQHRYSVINELIRLSDLFAINLCAYAIGVDHYHLVVEVDSQRARCWSNQDIIKRWAQLFDCPALLKRALTNEPLSKAERLLVTDRVRLYRSRLTDLSWFMRCLSEHIAQLAKLEDSNFKRFWRGTYKTQALLTESELICGMAHVDLNLLITDKTFSAEKACCSSLLQRLISNIAATNLSISEWLKPFSMPTPESFFSTVKNQPTAQCSETDYLQLVEWSYRKVTGKRPKTLPPVPAILAHYGITARQFLNYLHHIEADIIGQYRSLYILSQKAQRWLCKTYLTVNRGTVKAAKAIAHSAVLRDWVRPKAAR